MWLLIGLSGSALVAVIALAIALVSAATGGLLVIITLSNQSTIRVVRGESASGVLMAVDTDGLRQLNELYSAPKTCSERNYGAASGILQKLRLCDSPSPHITTDMGKRDIVVIPQGTQARYRSRSFVLPDGRLIKPYAANRYAMARDGALEVERIKITQGPLQNIEGWVAVQFVGRVGGF